MQPLRHSRFQKRVPSQKGPRGSFTMVELLAVIAIMAVLIAGAIYFTANYIQWAKQTTEKEIYTVLNDELTRYKGNGGNVSALTLGAPMNDIFAALQTPVVPAGMPASFSQQFMATNYTYPGRSLQAVGTGEQYHFYQVDQYVGQNLSLGTPTSKYPNGYTYMDNGGSAAYSFTSLGTSTGYWAWSNSNGTVTGPLVAGTVSIPAGNTGVKVWSCSSSSTAASGNITALYFNSCGLTTLNVSGCTTLTGLQCSNNSLTTLNISGCTSLSYVSCQSNFLTSINASGCPSMYDLFCTSNAAGCTINITGDHGIYSFTHDASAVITGP